MEKTETASPFYRHKEGRCTCTGGGRSRRSSLNRGRAVANYCGKYTVDTGDRGTGRGSRHGRRPWPYGDRADVLAAPAGGVVVAVEDSSSALDVAAFRGSGRRRS